MLVFLEPKWGNIKVSHKITIVEWSSIVDLQMINKNNLKLIISDLCWEHFSLFVSLSATLIYNSLHNLTCSDFV